MIASGEKVFYSKDFDVAIIIAGNEPLDLAAGCFNAVMPDKTEYFLDTIGQEMDKGKLKTGDMRRGLVAFATPDETINKASIVKFVSPCK